MLLKSDPGLRKLSLFKVGKGGYEKRYGDQDKSMGDMEVHEHVIVNGKVGELKEPILHRNFNNLSRFIIKHDEYSNYECKVHAEGVKTAKFRKVLRALRNRSARYLKKKLIRNPLSPIFFFFYLYFFKGGCLEGRQVLLYHVPMYLPAFHKAQKYMR